MKKILITGGTGFLGSHLCEELSQTSKQRIITEYNWDAITNQHINVFNKVK